MDEDNDLNGLLGISLSDPEDNTCDPEPVVPRDYQSEEMFQAVRAAYVPKIENGDLHRTLELLNPPTSTASNPTINSSTTPNSTAKSLHKHEQQSLLHAVEELYFFRRYTEGASLAKKILDRSTTDKEEKGNAWFVLDEDIRELLGTYERMCLRTKVKVEVFEEDGSAAGTGTGTGATVDGGVVVRT